MAMLRNFIGKSAVSLLCLLLLAGCNQKIDGSSKEAFDASLEKVSRTLPAEDQGRLRKSLGYLRLRSMNLAGMFSGGKRTGDPEVILREMVNGKTAAEVIELGDGIRVEQLARRDAALKWRQAQTNLPPLREGPQGGPGAQPQPGQPAAVQVPLLKP